MQSLTTQDFARSAECQDVTVPVQSQSPHLVAAHAAFLNPKGRILFGDVLLFSRGLIGDDQVLLDVHSLSLHGLIRHLKMYKLRSQVIISVL